MKTIDEIQASLLAIASQLEELSDDLRRIKAGASDTNAAVNTQEYRNSLAAAERRAADAPICNKILNKSGELARRTYMRFLSAAAGSDISKIEFARRIGIGSGSTLSAENLALERLHIDESFPRDISEYLKDLKHPLLLDSLVTANLSGSADDETVSLIADAADILGIDSDTAEIIAKLAAAILQKDKSLFKNIVCRKPLPGLSHLIPRDWIRSVYVGEVDTYKNNIAVKEGWVNKGKKLWAQDISPRLTSMMTARNLLYPQSDNRQSDNRMYAPIYAPISGIFYLTRKYQEADNSTIFNAYIRSPFDDSELN